MKLQHKIKYEIFFIHLGQIRKLHKACVGTWKQSQLLTLESDSGIGFISLAPVQKPDPLKDNFKFGIKKEPTNHAMMQAKDSQKLKIPFVGV